MLHREGVSIDEFCNKVEATRLQSSMASSARLVVLTYYQPDFWSRSTARLSLIPMWGAFSVKAGFRHQHRPTRPSRCCNWRSGALRKTKRVSNSLSGVGDPATGRHGS